jgi:hypothetical protein
VCGATAPVEVHPFFSTASRPLCRLASWSHAILDNYAFQKHPKVLAGSPGNPRWMFHFHPPPPDPGTMRSTLSSPHSPAGDCNAASFARSSTRRPRSTGTSASTTANPNPSFGPPTLIASSRRSIQGDQVLGVRTLASERGVPEGRVAGKQVRFSADRR